MVSKRCLEDVYHIQLSLSLCPKAWGICLIILGLIANIIFCEFLLYGSITISANLGHS